MLLVLDIGNTNTVVGVYDGERLVAHWRLTTARNRTDDEYAILMASLFTRHHLAPEQIKQAVLGSVVPTLTGAFEKAVEGCFGIKPLVVGPGVKTGIKLKFDNPKEIGADRIANAVGGFAKYGGPLIIVDFGTATTFDYISEDGTYMGGVIAPGMKIAAEALFERASKLPKVELEYPETVLGRNTVQSMQSGIMHGYAALVDGLVERLRSETETGARVVGTGGLAGVLAPRTMTLKTVDDWITLDGLRIIFERNHP